MADGVRVSQPEPAQGKQPGRVTSTTLAGPHAAALQGRSDMMNSGPRVRALQRKADMMSGSQKMPVQGAWNVAEIGRQKADLDLAQHFPGGAEGSALHHIVSRDTLNKLAFALDRALGADVEEARQFRAALSAATGATINREARGDTAKTLHNMPFNIAYGPNNPLGDPGTGFDPNTIEDDQGKRVLDPVSRHLFVLDQLVQTHTLAELGGAESGDLWGQAKKALDDAVADYDQRSDKLDAPMLEQWVAVGEGHARRYFRKGEKNYLSADDGADRFERLPLPAVEELGFRAAVRGEAADDNEAEELDTYAYASPEKFHHFLERHTYRYFTFADRDIKLINSFWPQGTSLENISAYANAALLFIHSYVADLYEMKGDDDLPGFVGLKNTTIPGVPVPVYIMFGIDDRGEGVYEMDLRTLAPEGGSDAYTAADLRQIRQQHLAQQ